MFVCPLTVFIANYTYSQTPSTVYSRLKASISSHRPVFICPKQGAKTDSKCVRCLGMCPCCIHRNPASFKWTKIRRVCFMHLSPVILTVNKNYTCVHIVDRSAKLLLWEMKIRHEHMLHSSKSKVTFKANENWTFVDIAPIKVQSYFSSEWKLYTCVFCTCHSPQ